jgi:hypothetical protein
MIQRIASLRPVAAVFRHTFHHIDRWGLAALRGRTLSGVLAGVPNIMLTTTGAKSGKARTVPLVGVPLDAGAIAVIGTGRASRSRPAASRTLTSTTRSCDAPTTCTSGSPSTAAASHGGPCRSSSCDDSRPRPVGIMGT